MDEEEQVRRKVAEVVGDYAPVRDWRASILKWTGAAVLAVATAAGVIAIIHTHLTRPAPAPAPAKPVPIRILPAG